MDTKVNYSVVGAFVIILTAVFILMIIWLSSGLAAKSYKIYMVHMNESVAGLNVDSPVKFNGVEVGRVKKIVLNPDNPQIVNLLLDIEENTPITVDTRATLNIQGLTGVATVALKTIGPNTTPLKKEKGEKHPVIKSAPSLFARLDVALTDLTNNLSEISKSIRSVLDPENQRAFKETLKNLSSVSQNLATHNQAITHILQNTAKVSQQLPNTIQSFNNQTLPAANQLLHSLQNTSNNMVVISNEIKQNPSVIIRGKSPPPLGPGE